MHIERYTRRYEVFKLLGKPFESVALLVAYVFCHNALLLVFHLRYNHVVDATYKEFLARLFLIFGCIFLIEIAYGILHLTNPGDVVSIHIGVDSIRHASHKQIFLELSQQVGMLCLRE